MDRARAVKPSKGIGPCYGEEVIHPALDNLDGLQAELGFIAVQTGWQGLEIVGEQQETDNDDKAQNNQFPSLKGLLPLDCFCARLTDESQNKRDQAGQPQKGTPKRGAGLSTR
jgi:hypothetical protein